MQVNQLISLLSMSSIYRLPYVPNSTGHSCHIILCGHVSDWRRLERFLREFFHPDRQSSHTPDFHVVVLSPMEPSDDIKALLLSPLFDARTSYLIGTALSFEDLQKARADIASGMRSSI